MGRRLTFRIQWDPAPAPRSAPRYFIARTNDPHWRWRVGDRTGASGDIEARTRADARALCEFGNAQPEHRDD